MIDNPLSSNEALKASGSIIKSDRENLVDAEKKIAALELDLRNKNAENEKLRWQCAQLRIGITAMGEHYKCPPDKCKKIFDKYCAKQEKIYNQMVEEKKKEIVEQFKAGKVPDLRVMSEPPKA